MCRYSGQHRHRRLRAQSLIRHFLRLLLSFPVGGLPGRVQPRTPQCPLIARPVTPQRLLTRPARALARGAVALAAVATPAHADRLAATLIEENPQPALFTVVRTDFGWTFNPDFAMLPDGHRYHRGDGPEGSGVLPWAFTLSALGRADHHSRDEFTR